MSLVWRTPPPYDSSYASSVAPGVEYQITRVRRGQKRVSLNVLTPRAGTPFINTASQGEFPNMDAAKEYAEKYEAAVRRNAGIQENPISRGAGVALLGAGVVLGVAGLLWASTKNKTQLTPHAYPVTAGLSYSVTIRSTLDPTQWSATSLKTVFPNGTLAETGAANEWDLDGVAAQSGSVTDDPPNWTITGWVENGAPVASNQ